MLRHQSGVLGTSDGSEDGRLLSGVLDSLARQEGGSTVGELNDDWGVDISGGLQDSVDGGGGGAVEGCNDKTDQHGHHHTELSHLAEPLRSPCSESAT